MVSFKTRSFQTELLDAQDVPSGLIHQNLGELDLLNRFLGGHRVSLEGIRHLVADPKKIYHIADLGCGSGDVLKYIARWARYNAYQVQLTGVDRNPDVIAYLQKSCSAYPEIRGVASDYRDYLQKGEKIDIVHAALFCHHLNDRELTELFSLLKSTISCGFVVNDIQRSVVAYYSAWIMTRLLNGSSLSKHDGPVSVLRAFKRDELQKLLMEAGLRNHLIRWRWAFRYLVVVKTDGYGT